MHADILKALDKVIKQERETATDCIESNKGWMNAEVHKCIAEAFQSFRDSLSDDQPG